MSSERTTNAVWSGKAGEVAVYADGGSIWRAEPSTPAEGAAEIAVYEPTEWDGDTETAWRVIVDGKVDGTIRFV